jgi:putative SOS response-associated peptidase YedK
VRTLHTDDALARVGQALSPHRDLGKAAQRCAGLQHRADRSGAVRHRGENGGQKLREGRWWLVPWWAKEMPKQAMFNARIETVDTSGSFKDAFASTRCLIPADGFFEWTKSPADGGRDPWHIFLPGPRPFSFAGLWAHNRQLDVTSCTIITMPAGEPMAKLHDRQPVILEEPAYDAWLDPRTPAAEAKSLLSRNLDGELHFRRVSRAVNSVKNQGSECVEPVNPL